MEMARDLRLEGLEIGIKAAVFSASASVSASGYARARHVV